MVQRRIVILDVDIMVGIGIIAWSRCYQWVFEVTDGIIRLFVFGFVLHFDLLQRRFLCRVTGRGAHVGRVHDAPVGSNDIFGNLSAIIF